MKITGAKVDDQVISQLLKVAHNEGFTKESKINIESASAKGDNYAGEVFRATIEEQGRTLKLILKVPHSNPMQREALQSDILWTKEGNLYTKIVPMFNDFQKKKGIASIFTGTAKCYAATTDAIIMEDLKDTGYTLADRFKGLQYEELKLVITELAKYHALSFAMKHQQPDKYTQIEQLTGREVFETFVDNDATKQYFSGMATGSVKLVKDEQDKQKYEIFANNYIQGLFDVTHAEEEYTCLNHGDCWVNNMLFKYSENEPKTPLSVKLIDFQIIRQTSPILDLSYLIYCSTEKIIRDKHLDQVWKLYLDSLHNNIRLLGSDPDVVYPRDVFEKQMKKYSKFGLMMAVITIPLFTAKKEDAPDMEMDPNNSEAMEKLAADMANLWENDLTRRRMNDTIHEMVENNYI